jgi:hypothetical protein
VDHCKYEGPLTHSAAYDTGIRTLAEFAPCGKSRLIQRTESRKSGGHRNGDTWSIPVYYAVMLDNHGANTPIFLRRWYA